MKQLFFLILSNLLFLLTDLSAEAQYKIGVSLPLTGPAATYGKEVLNILKFANSRIKPAIFDLIIEDDKCNARESVNIARKFTDIDKVDFVLGIPCSTTVLATAPIYEKTRTVAISALGSAPDISNAGEYIYRTRPNELEGAQLLYKWISARHKRVGTLSEQTDYALGTIKAFTEQNKVNSLIIHQEEFSPGTIDFRTQILKLKTLKIDSLIINGQSEATLINLINQISKQHLNIPLYGFIGCASSYFLKGTGSLAEGLILTNLLVSKDTLTAEGKEIFQDYKLKYGPVKTGDFVFVTTYESFNALNQAVKSGKGVKKSLDSDIFKGMMGDYTFDSNGDVKGWGYSLSVIRNGGIEKLD